MSSTATFHFYSGGGEIEFPVHKWVLMRTANVGTNVFINTNNNIIIIIIVAIIQAKVGLGMPDCLSVCPLEQWNTIARHIGGNHIK